MEDLLPLFSYYKPLIFEEMEEHRTKNGVNWVISEVRSRDDAFD